MQSALLDLRSGFEDRAQANPRSSALMRAIQEERKFFPQG